MTTTPAPVTTNPASHPLASPAPQTISAEPDELLILIKAVMLLWKKKWWIALITVIFTALGVAYALNATKTFTSEAIIAPKEAGKGLGAGMLSQLGGMGGLMAAQLGIGGASLDRMAIIAESHDMAEILIKKYDLLPHLYHKKYDFENKQWKFKDTLDIPTIKHGIEKLQKGTLSISTDIKRNVIKIKFSSYDSVHCAVVLGQFLKELNSRIRSDVIKEANINKAYLSSEMKRTADPWVIQKLQSLIGMEVEKSLMVAGNAFDILVSPVEPLRKTKPKRRLIVMGAFCFGIFSGVALVLIHQYAGVFRRLLNSPRMKTISQM